MKPNTNSKIKLKHNKTSHYINKNPKLESPHKAHNKIKTVLPLKSTHQYQRCNRVKKGRDEQWTTSLNGVVFVIESPF
ncbi:hypothetical protein LOK49_LG11G00297 [Camellia lanceoleosa]|uniref:Uncharacterized protein n=1 Tax=Camellia lanceoleosa TaxID=1840588 RepID=A0ACC0FYT1_9ERIC|nr:hypothetical protein LOK49_LG11G00297 [Camellia lanceoleosa]